MLSYDEGGGVGITPADGIEPALTVAGAVCGLGMLVEEY
jgi:hypothetical protein